MKNKNFFMRFLSYLDFKSQVKCAEAQDNQFKEYDLEVEGDPFSSLSYFIPIYIGDKKLRFQVDSGANNCCVGYRFIKSLPHFNTGITEECHSLTSELRSRIILVEFGLEPGYSEEDAFCIEFATQTRKYAPYYDESYYVGLLGANFLRFCEVDFRNAKIRVFKTNGTKIQNLTSTSNEDF